MAHPWPLFDLAVRTPRLELRLPTDAELLPLIDVARAGIHDPEVMPFYEPWTDVEGEAFDRALLAFHWSSRTRLAPDDWALVLGIFVDGAFAGEINLNSIHRGAFQSAYIGYWIDERVAGNGYMPESVVLVLRFGFEQLGLHRMQIAIIPRNANSRRVVDKLGLREEGVALRYLEINGEWEDHVRYAITSEEWETRRDELSAAWL